MAPLARVPAPVGVLTRLPGDGNQLALTVDDGVSSAVVGAFGQFCRDTGTRLTFFANGVNASWTDNAAALRVYGREGQPCPTPGCTGTIKRIVQSGRSTYYCPVCQKP